MSEEPNRRCSKCKEVKRECDFYRKKGQGGYSYRCKECCKAYMRKWWEIHLNKVHQNRKLVNTKYRTKKMRLEALNEEIKKNGNQTNKAS